MSPEEFGDWLGQRHRRVSNETFEKPLIMGVLNVTSDSFYDGGKYLSLERACEHAFELISHGADIIDIGGESTKPGALQVPIDVELERIIPVIKKIRLHSDICISIDTYKPEAMAAAVYAGANIINDIYALRREGALTTAAELGVPICLMHMQGQPHNMQENPHYPKGVSEELMHFFSDRIYACEQVGIKKELLILDPGFGFGKLVKHNMNLLREFEKLSQFNLPILLGVSRKSTIGAILDKDVNARLIGSISIALYAALQGAGILRTHDVCETNQALKMIDAIYRAD